MSTYWGALDRWGLVGDRDSGAFHRHKSSMENARKVGVPEAREPVHARAAC